MLTDIHIHQTCFSVTPCAHRCIHIYESWHRCMCICERAIVYSQVCVCLYVSEFGSLGRWRGVCGCWHAGLNHGSEHSLVTLSAENLDDAAWRTLPWNVSVRFTYFICLLVSVMSISRIGAHVAVMVRVRCACRRLTEHFTICVRKGLLLKCMLYDET